MRVFDFIHQGGAIMYILVLINILGIAIMATKFFALSREKKNEDLIISDLSEKMSIHGNIKDSTALIELSKQELNGFISKLEKGLNTIKIIATISPLLGLLGTVLGVLIAFNVISQTGLSNPASFAQGISMALITTVGGLIVAIPHYIGHNYLLGMLDELEGNLEKKLLAKKLK
jgi:biopolymer transport protein ExbB